MDLIFNELSLEPPLQHVSEAHAVMASMVETMVVGLRHRTIKALRTDSQFVLRRLSTDYTLSDWIADGRVDREAKRLIVSSASKAPYVDTLANELQGDRLAEFTRRGAIALGCGVAVLRDEAVLSVHRDTWSEDPILLDAVYVTETGTQEVQEEVCNIYSPGCFDRRADWFVERAQRSVRSGNDVIADAEGLFQHLEFCTNAQRQLQALRGTEPEFVSIVRHLVALSRTAAAWQSGPFVAGYPFPCSPDSAPTLAMYGEQRRFSCPDGHVRQFSWHSKINIGARRIYFYPQQPGETVLVGYIGPHLDIVSN